AKGLAILTVLKAGLLFSGQGGLGLVVARRTSGWLNIAYGRAAGWSGPSAIATGGAGFGFQVGAEVTDYVMVLNTDDAVKAFSRDGNVTLGGDLSVAAGPVGRAASAGPPTAAIYSYSRSKGLFAGFSITGTVMVTRNGANAKYYGRNVTPAEI